MTGTPDPGSPRPRHAGGAPTAGVRGALAGGALLLGIMLPVAAAAILLGGVGIDADGRPALARWLALESVAGAAAAVAAGALSRRVAGGPRGPALLAAGVLAAGLVEAAILLLARSASGVHMPAWLAFLPPFAGAAGVLAGGWRPGVRAPGRGPSAGTVLRYAVPALALLCGTALAAFAVPRLGDGREARVVATALALDLTVTVPALAGLLLVRARRLPWIALLPIVALGYALAAAALPDRHRGVLEGMRFLVVAAEALLVLALVRRARAALRGTADGAGDFATRIRAASHRLLGHRVAAGILATEVALLHHALRGPRRRGPDAGAFTAHREVGYLPVLVGLLLLLAVETVALHALATLWGPVASWTLTGLSLYAIVWLLGDYRALSARPTRITADRLLLRLGLRWEVDLPLDRIAAVEPWAERDAPPARDALTVTLIGPPDTRVVLCEPVEAIGMYGRTRTVREIRLRVDDAARFRAALRAALHRPPEE